MSYRERIEGFLKAVDILIAAAALPDILSFSLIDFNNFNFFEEKYINMVEAKKEVVADPAAPEKSDATKEEKKIGKFTHGDHMIHLLFQKGKKFVPLTKDET